jgi:hypothetical protein
MGFPVNLCALCGSSFMSAKENIADIQRKIATAANRSGRKANDVVLIAVTKTFGPDRIREAYDAGLRLFGENRVQEFAGKMKELTDLKAAEWHMIGHLQSNKASKAAELFSAIDSVDSVRLAERLNAAAAERGKKLKVLVEINLGGEAAKSGVDPDSQELWQLLESAPKWSQLQIQGLMTVPPFTENPEGARPYFRRLRGCHRGRIHLRPARNSHFRRTAETRVMISPQRSQSTQRKPLGRKPPRSLRTLRLSFSVLREQER